MLWTIDQSTHQLEQIGFKSTGEYENGVSNENYLWTSGGSVDWTEHVKYETKINKASGQQKNIPITYHSQMLLLAKDRISSELQATVKNSQKWNRNGRLNYPLRCGFHEICLGFPKLGGDWTESLYGWKNHVRCKRDWDTNVGAGGTEVMLDKRSEKYLQDTKKSVVYWSSCAVTPPPLGFHHTTWCRRRCSWLSCAKTSGRKLKGVLRYRLGRTNNETSIRGKVTPGHLKPQYLNNEVIDNVQRKLNDME